MIETSTCAQHPRPAEPRYHQREHGTCPKLQVTIGPATERGFFYDFDMSEPIADKDLKKVKQEMQRIIKANLPIIREEVRPGWCSRQLDPPAVTMADPRSSWSTTPWSPGLAVSCPLLKPCTLTDPFPQLVLALQGKLSITMLVPALQGCCQSQCKVKQNNLLCNMRAGQGQVLGRPVQAGRKCLSVGDCFRYRVRRHSSAYRSKGRCTRLKFWTASLPGGSPCKHRVQPNACASSWGSQAPAGSRPYRTEPGAALARQCTGSGPLAFGLVVSSCLLVSQVHSAAGHSQ